MTRTRWAAVVLLGSSLLASAPAFAQPVRSPEATRDAGKHFQRGVALFNEADYAGALAEFKKAYEIAPNPAVLYNIGQTHFQLRSYAAALQVFERYLAEAGASADHRAEAEANVETLRARVGKIDVVAADGTEVTIDDEVAGKTPLPPIQAAVGRRKVTVFKDGNQQVRFAEVSAGETVRVEIKAAGVDASNATRTEPTYAPSAESSSSVLPTALWIGTGVLAAGAVTTGILAIGASSDLSEERAKPAGVTTRTKLDDLESKTATLALVTDILAGAAIVTGGIALYMTITAKPSRTGALPPPTRPGLDVRVGVSRVALEGRF
jgi:Tetratricopeptide repeat